MRVVPLQVEEYSIYGRTVKIDCVLSIPSVSLPAGLASNDMPIGIMLYARPGALSRHACCGGFPAQFPALSLCNSAKLKPHRTCVHACCTACMLEGV